MKSLKNCIKLSCSVKIYVPSTVDVKSVLCASQAGEWIDKTLNLLSNEFGGATSTNALGAWCSTQGDLIKENITLVFAFAPQNQLETSIDKIYDFCLSMKKELNQEAIALEVNGELYLL